MKLSIFFTAAAIGLIASSLPAEACFNWCAWWTWGRRNVAIDNRPLLSDAANNEVELVDEPIELQMSALAYQPPVFDPPPDPIVQPHGIRESEIRRAFDIAYGNQRFDSSDAKTETYAKWKASIGKVQHYWDEPRRATYDYVADADNYIWATLHQETSQLTFGIREQANLSNLNNDIGVRETPFGMFARAYVALGGMDAVSSIKETWQKNGLEAFGFESMIRSKISPLSAADQSVTGQIANQFYGMSAENYSANNASHFVTFKSSPYRNSIMNVEE